MSRHTSARPLVRAGAPLAALAALSLTVLVAPPASAHVSGTPSETAAGSYTVFTLSVPHGCDGSPTTEVEIQVPESVLSVTPTRNPYYDLETRIEQLDEPVEDSHGNEVTERVASIVYTAKDEPLPDGERDTLELSFQVPDAAGELLAFPTIQTCEQGENGWIEVPAEGQDAEELESPAPAFEITEASGEGHGEDASAEEASQEGTAAAPAEETEATTGGSGTLGWTGVALGALGLLAGGTALARSRKSA